MEPKSRSRRGESSIVKIMVSCLVVNRLLRHCIPLVGLHPRPLDAQLPQPWAVVINTRLRMSMAITPAAAGKTAANILQAQCRRAIPTSMGLQIASRSRIRWIARSTWPSPRIKLQVSDRASSHSMSIWTTSRQWIMWTGALSRLIRRIQMRGHRMAQLALRWSFHHHMPKVLEQLSRWTPEIGRWRWLIIRHYIIKICELVPYGIILQVMSWARKFPASLAIWPSTDSKQVSTPGSQVFLEATLRTEKCQFERRKSYSTWRKRRQKSYYRYNNRNWPTLSPNAESALRKRMKPTTLWFPHASAKAIPVTFISSACESGWSRRAQRRKVSMSRRIAGRRWSASCASRDFPARYLLMEPFLRKAWARRKSRNWENL